MISAAAMLGQRNGSKQTKRRKVCNKKIGDGYKNGACDEMEGCCSWVGNRKQDGI